MKEGCPVCRLRKCSKCGELFSGQNNCPVCTGTHYRQKQFEGVETEVGSDGYHSFYRRRIQPVRRLFETALAPWWPTALFEFTPVEKEVLRKCLDGKKAPIVLNDLRVVRWLSARMESLDFRFVEFASRECLRHLTRQRKTLWLLSLQEFGVTDAKLLANHRSSLYLKTPSPLSPPIATELSRHLGKVLSLRGFRKLEVQVAAELARHRKRLSLYDLEELTFDVAEQLKRHRGTRLCFPSVTRLNPEVASEIARYKGHTLYFESIKHPSLEILRAFGAFAGNVKFGKGTWENRHGPGSGD